MWEFWFGSIVSSLMNSTSYFILKFWVKSGDGICLTEKQKSKFVWIALANHCSTVKFSYSLQNLFIWSAVLSGIKFWSWIFCQNDVLFRFCVLLLDMIWKSLIPSTIVNFFFFPMFSFLQDYWEHSDKKLSSFFSIILVPPIVIGEVWPFVMASLIQLQM